MPAGVVSKRAAPQPLSVQLMPAPGGSSILEAHSPLASLSPPPALPATEDSYRVSESTDTIGSDGGRTPGEDRPDGRQTRGKDRPAATQRSRPPASELMAAPFDPTYYPARELDAYPALLRPLAIRYPERALAEQRGGRVLVMLRLSASGKIDEAAVVEAAPEGYFEAAALDALKHAAFSAARRNGMPVRSRVLINVSFDPQAAAAATR